VEEIGFMVVSSFLVPESQPEATDAFFWAGRARETHCNFLPEMKFAGFELGSIHGK
jgi:hypothetical protein